MTDYDYGWKAGVGRAVEVLDVYQEMGCDTIGLNETRCSGQSALLQAEYVVYCSCESGGDGEGKKGRTRGHSATWAAFGHLAVESVGTSVWWSDFSILQAFCKETQPDNHLLAKCLEQFHEAPAII